MTCLANSDRCHQLNGYARRVKRLGCFVLLVGCGFQSNPQGGPDASPPVVDASVDSPPIMTDGPPPDARVCFGVALVKVCLDKAPTQPVTFSGMTALDTGRASSCTQTVPQTNGPELCVVAGTTVTVSGTLTVQGSRPLVLIGATAVSVPGTLDLSSTTNTNPRRPAPGGNPHKP